MGDMGRLWVSAGRNRRGMALWRELEEDLVIVVVLVLVLIYSLVDLLLWRRIVV